MHVGEASKATLEMALQMTEVPETLREFCNSCMRSIGWRSQDDEGVANVTESVIESFLVEKLGVIARRVLTGNGTIRCEAIRGGMFTEDFEDQCPHWANRELGGRKICHNCAKSAAGGYPLSFVGEGRGVPKLYVIWASGPHELEARAKEAADRLRVCA